jgi:molybdopterin-guanine dinucleotide biosynthesis adapter protein
MRANETHALPIPALAVCAASSGMGKTTLLVKLIPVLRSRGLRISVIKHTHHRFELDQPGKDSYRLRESGAVQTLIGSSQRWALMTELDHLPTAPPEPTLADLLARLDPTLADLILVEGFKHEPIPKIEVHRPALALPLLAATDANVIAVASDAPLSIDRPLLDLNEAETIADFIVDWMKSCTRSVASPTENA